MQEVINQFLASGWEVHVTFFVMMSFLIWIMVKK